MDADGLLSAGVPGVQLTWMDARVGDRVITPRIGKPVEIQALWLNALSAASRLEPRWADVFERGRTAFAERFWNDGSKRRFYNDLERTLCAILSVGVVDRVPCGGTAVFHDGSQGIDELAGEFRSKPFFFVFEVHVDVPAPIV